jgi:hypothetical protein
MLCIAEASQASGPFSRTISQEDLSALELTPVDEDLLAWAFLADLAGVAHLSRLPWLVLQERRGPLVGERFAVPRLVFEADWPSKQAQITLDDVPTFRDSSGARRARPLLIAELLALDIEGLTVRELVQRDRPELYASRGVRVKKENAEANLRRRRRRTRERLATAGALPWAAFERGELPQHWRQHPRFLEALDQWQRDGDPTREAALFCIKLALREWSNLPTPDDHWGDARCLGPRYKPVARRTINE